jgi:hypothetical protein
VTIDILTAQGDIERERERERERIPNRGSSRRGNEPNFGH